jgi:hypothetical protein
MDIFEKLTTSKLWLLGKKILQIALLKKFRDDILSRLKRATFPALWF